ncbi:MAG: hypothetical protein NNA22_03530 [Nitrospira sp.]|nr:hypothetical protein [Nitrospira sp.]
MEVLQACRDYRLQQEFITPYTPERNGIIERFYTPRRRHSTFGYLSPMELERQAE